MKLLKYKNNWEHDEYYIDDHQLSDLKSVSIDGETYRVQGKEVTVGYNDMGHTYSSTSPHYFVPVTIFGKKTSYDIKNLIKMGIKVYAVKYTLAKDK